MFDGVRKIGRAFEYDGILWLSYSGCGVEFLSEGNTEISLVSDRVAELGDAEIHYASYAIYIDGTRVARNRLEGTTRTHAFMAEGVHTYKVVKLSESNDSSLGISAIRGQAIRPTQAKSMKVEIVGDSITCGYGVEGKLGETYTTATENFFKAWAYLTCSKLDAEYSAVSKSGSGIISGYTDSGDRNTLNIITDYYDYCGCSMAGLSDGSRPSQIDYDFTYAPDLVMVNIGTNDISYCLPRDEQGRLKISKEESRARRRDFYTAYKQFILHIREKNPQAKLLCLLGIMGTGLNEDAELAVNELRLAGDTRIFWLPMPEQDAAVDGFGTDYHPTEATQKKAAERVFDFIKTNSIV